MGVWPAGVVVLLCVVLGNARRVEAGALQKRGRSGGTSARWWLAFIFRRLLSASRFLRRPHPLRRRRCWLDRSSRRRPQAEALRLQWDGSLHRCEARALCEAMNMSEAPMRRGNEPSANNPGPGQNCSSLPAPPGPLYARSFKLSSPVLVDFVGRSASCILFFHSRTPQRACTSLLHLAIPLLSSYTRSLTCHNLQYCLDILPFSREPSPSSTPVPKFSAL